jgi:hypothetical protein
MDYALNWMEMAKCRTHLLSGFTKTANSVESAHGFRVCRDEDHTIVLHFQARAEWNGRWYGMAGQGGVATEIGFRFWKGPPLGDLTAAPRKPLHLRVKSDVVHRDMVAALLAHRLEDAVDWLREAVQTGYVPVKLIADGIRPGNVGFEADIGTGEVKCLVQHLGLEPMQNLFRLPAELIQSTPASRSDVPSRALPLIQFKDPNVRRDEVKRLDAMVRPYTMFFSCRASWLIYSLMPCLA